MIFEQLKKLKKITKKNGREGSEVHKIQERKGKLPSRFIQM